MPSPTTERSNDDWLAALSSAPPDGEVIADLQGLVRGALGKALRSRSLDEATLDDLVQVAVVHVLDKLSKFEGRSRFTTWAYSVAVRAALTELRKPIYQAGTDDDIALEGATAGSPGPAAAVEQDEIVKILHRVVEEELTDRQRVAIQGLLAGRAPEEVMEELGINRNALHKLHHDARRKLKAGLGAAGICDVAVRESLGLPSEDT